MVIWFGTFLIGNLFLYFREPSATFNHGQSLLKIDARGTEEAHAYRTVQASEESGPFPGGREGGEDVECHIAPRVAMRRQGASNGSGADSGLHV